MFMKKLYILLTPLLLFTTFFVIPGSVAATTFKSADSITLKADEAVSGNYYAAGKTIVIDGTVDGDLFCAAETVRVNGQINGDIICAGKTITVTGIVQGNMRIAAKDAVITGQIGRNVNILAQTATLKPTAKVTGELNAATQSLTLDGIVNKDIAVGVEEFNMTGNAGNAIISASQFNFGKTAKINGDLTYYSDTEMKPATGVVAGNVKYLKAQPEKSHEQRPNTVADFLSSVIASILGALLVGLALVWFLPNAVSHVTQVMQSNPGRTILWGILFSIIVPFVAVILLFTFVGIPTAILLAAVYGIALLVSRVFAGIVVGKMLIEKYSPKHKNDLFWEVLAGITVSWIVFSLPLLGGMLSLLAFWWGIGGVFLTLKAQRHTK